MHEHDIQNLTRHIVSSHDLFLSLNLNHKHSRIDPDDDNNRRIGAENVLACHKV